MPPREGPNAMQVSQMGHKVLQKKNNNNNWRTQPVKGIFHQANPLRRSAIL